MENKEVQKKYSLRKFKGIGLASAVIGLFFANQSVYANVTSDGKEETTLVGEFEKVSSSAKTTFTDDKNATKKVTVDVVADIRYNQPTKANQNTSDADGTDSLNYHSEATVNYILESNNSKLQDSKKVDGEKATVKTPYDKKGIAYDTDGKDYRESTVEKTGEAITEDTGKVESIKANDKEYTLVRSEVVNKDKAIYKKTNFNDIEAPVSPEGMHNNLGEINYGKITGKVYLVEETSDGHYGKFVEATNIKSDEEAINAWKNGQATAKDFTKENVTLKEGDTVLVMDRDTYAHGSGTRTVNTINYRRKKVPATQEYDEVVSSEEIKEVGAYPTYAFGDEILNDSFLTVGKDGVFGTSDDGEVTFKNEEHLRYERNWKIVNRFSEMTAVPDVDFRKMSVNEILRYMQSEVYGVLEYFDYYAKTDEQRQKVQERRAIVDRNILDAAEMIKNENINVAAQSWRIAFLSPDKEKLTALRKHIESGEKVLDELLLTLKTDEENVAQYGNHKNVKKITKEVLYYEENYKPLYGSRLDYPKFSYRKIVSYHKDAESEHYSDWEKVNPEVETREDSVYTNKGSVTISDDLSNINVVHTNSKTTETEFTKQDVKTKEETDYEIKEIITPIRAYKVMSEGNVVVNHYYKEVEISEVPKDAPVLEVPEFEGGVASEEPPVLEVPEFKGGVISSDPPILEVPEYEGGVASEEPPVLEVPEFEGGVVSSDPPILELPEYEGGVASEEPPVLEVPEFKDGVVSSNPPILELPEYEGGVVPLNPPTVEIPELKIPEETKPTPEPKPEPKPKPEEPKKEEPTPNDVIPSNEEKENQTTLPTNKVEELPQTGTGNEFEIFGAAASSILAGLGFVIPRKQRKK